MKSLGSRLTCKSQKCKLASRSWGLESEGWESGNGKWTMEFGRWEAEELYRICNGDWGMNVQKWMLWMGNWGEQKPYKTLVKRTIPQGQHPQPHRFDLEWVRPMNSKAPSWTVGEESDRSIPPTCTRSGGNEHTKLTGGRAGMTSQPWWNLKLITLSGSLGYDTRGETDAGQAAAGHGFRQRAVSAPARRYRASTTRRHGMVSYLAFPRPASRDGDPWPMIC